MKGFTAVNRNKFIASIRRGNSFSNSCATIRQLESTVKGWLDKGEEDSLKEGEEGTDFSNFFFDYREACAAVATDYRDILRDTGNPTAIKELLKSVDPDFGGSNRVVIDNFCQKLATLVKESCPEETYLILLKCMKQATQEFKQ